MFSFSTQFGAAAGADLPRTGAVGGVWNNIKESGTGRQSAVCAPVSRGRKKKKAACSLVVETLSHLATVRRLALLTADTRHRKPFNA